jgi:hypothetical protein
MHACIAKALTELGLFSEKPIEVDGVRVVPRKLFFKLTKSIPTTDDLVKKIEADELLETVMIDAIEIKGEKAGVGAFLLKPEGLELHSLFYRMPSTVPLLCISN